MSQDRKQSVSMPLPNGNTAVFAGTDLPSPFASIANVSAGPAIVRIAFGEGFGPNYVNWHTAVSMHRDDAKALMELLQDTISQQDQVHRSSGGE